jgi:hypothetical protein
LVRIGRHILCRVYPRMILYTFGPRRQPQVPVATGHEIEDAIAKAH